MKDEWSDTEGGNGMGLVRKRAGAGSGKKDGNLTEGPIGRGLFRFMIPIFLGQLLQQLYNMADAWVVGNFASNDAFAAVSLSSNVNMSVITFFAGIAVCWVHCKRPHGERNLRPYDKFCPYPQ